MDTYCDKYYVGVRFDDGGKSYYFSTNYDDLAIGDSVVVETIAGLEMGKISTSLMFCDDYKASTALKPIVRKPTREDIEDYNQNIKDSKRAIEVAETEVRRLNLPMNLIEANYTLDGSRVTITYSSENRVDFRELLHVLAPQFKCRIELHQIASRDKAKMIGGIGICGLPLCCSTFLNQFDGISISRAKNQMLTLNIPKLSGHCGKLICCLLYEDDAYTEAKKDFPRLGSSVRIDGKEFTISGMNILSRTLKLHAPDEIKFISLDEYTSAINHGEKPKVVPNLQNEKSPQNRFQGKETSSNNNKQFVGKRYNADNNGKKK